MPTSNSDAERRDVRHNVFQVAQLAFGDDRWRCHVLNLSAHGALLHCETLSPGAGRLHLVTATLREDASVRWRHGDRVGIRFDSALTSEVLRRAIAG